MNVRIKYSKFGALKFVGHLDMLRYLQKAIRRSGIDAIYTNGFNPHQIMSFASPMGVGLTSDGEYVDIELNSSDEPDVMIKLLNSVMTDGFLVTGFYHLPDWELNKRKDTAMSLVAGADYKVTMRYPGMIKREEFVKSFTEWIKKPELFITKKTKKNERELDLKPYIYSYAFTAQELAGNIGRPLDEVLKGVEHSEGSDDNISIYLQLAAGSAVNVKPELVMEAYFNELGKELPEHAFLVHRMEIYQNAYHKGMTQLEIKKIMEDDASFTRKLVPLSEIV